MMSIVQAALDPKGIDLKTTKSIINVYLPKDLQTTLEKRGCGWHFVEGATKDFPPGNLVRYVRYGNCSIKRSRLNSPWGISVS